MVHDHRKFETALENCEIAAGAHEWKEAIRLFNNFTSDLKLHMRMEDEVLYPLFESEVGDANEDLAELNDEHDTLVRLLNDLACVIKNRDFDHFEESLEPLKQAMFEHNAHEEAVFKRMGTTSLLERRDEILARLNAISEAAGQRNWEF
jgi:hemerythrin-like domain-containing protein